ncbi:hypothetical protein TREPR_1012 [Treponema primitia ZAS-2]|uniref:Uncharacterized protein n=1 Tax=Treponema primitia (strain ATCC BAA-887 / DSM 12427 / ZAS-2) TaxID=545694 RepID=F5YHR3_TREPZ|nr:hypothetical protein [Treponema primitia]AEF84536.1 hypothetical protein TREPR_1012 [Treponema primitia ZAS-2]
MKFKFSIDITWVIFFMLLFLTIPYVYSQEYDIPNNITIYDGNFEKITSKITYYPPQLSNTGLTNTILLYYKNGSLTNALLYGKMGDSNSREYLSNAIDKCIEWAAVAKKNGVHELTKNTGKESAVMFATIMDSLYTNVYIVNYIFSIQKINGKETYCLIINYKTTDQANLGRNGGYLVITEKDFGELMKIISDDFLAQYDKQYVDRQKQGELFQ